VDAGARCARTSFARGCRSRKLGRPGGLLPFDDDRRPTIYRRAFVVVLVKKEHELATDHVDRDGRVSPFSISFRDDFEIAECVAVNDYCVAARRVSLALMAASNVKGVEVDSIDNKWRHARSPFIRQ
jgi:hypothetical protein